MSQKSRTVCWYHSRGRCRFGSECLNSHVDSHPHDVFHTPLQTGEEPSRYIGCVPIPTDRPIGLVLGAGSKNIRRLENALKSRDKGTSLHQPSDRREIKVIASDQEHFLETKNRLEHSFAALSPIPKKMWTFLLLDVHNDVQFKFCKYKGHMLRHYSTQVRDAAYVLQVDDAENGQHGTTRSEPYVPYKHCAGEPTFEPMRSSELKSEKEFRVVGDYHEVIKKLQECLELVRQDKRDTEEEKLEARFGRMIWHRLPADYISEGLRLEELEKFYYENSDYRTSLNTSVEASGACKLQEEMKEMSSASHTVDTYHLRTTICDERDPAGKSKMLDIRIMLMDDGTAKILGVNKDTQRKAVFDILCVQRQHDFRLHLGLQETVCKDNDTHFKSIQEIVKTVSVTDSGELTLVPYTNNWTVQFIRHKRRFSYVLGPEDIHMVTASQITELEVNHETCKAGDLQTISLKGCENIHWEVELCNLHWEPEFQREVGMSTQEALHRYLEHPFAEGTAVHRSLQPHAVGQKDLEDMFETLDMINYILGGVSG